MLTDIFSSTLIAVLITATTVLTSPLRACTPYAVKDEHNVPSQWARIGPASSKKMLNLHIDLKQNQFEELERHLYEGSPILGSSMLG